MKEKLVLDHITKLYKNGDGVQDINLSVHQGELITLLGPSGCGKTTILRTIGGFLNCDSGEIRIDGKDISMLPPEKRPTAMVFQSYNLWPHMTVFDNMEFGLKRSRVRKISKEERKKMITDMLELIKMPGVEKKYPGQMSGGQQQRIAIGRSLLLQPDVLLLDEPFSALDAKIRGQMREELRKIQTDLGITVVFVTHDQEEAMALSDRIVVMNKGCIEQIDTPINIYRKPASRYVASFIGEMNFIQQKDGSSLAVRPENITLSPLEGTAESGALAGKIRAIMILGHYGEITVDTDCGVVKAFVDPIESEKYNSGDLVLLEIGQSFHYDVQTNEEAG